MDSDTFIARNVDELRYCSETSRSAVNKPMLAVKSKHQLPLDHSS